MREFNVQQVKGFTIMSNYHLRDRNLSLKAKGLLSTMLSLPEDWDYSVSGLVSILKESKKAVQSALKELEESGYILRTRYQDEKGRFAYKYDVFMVPNDSEPQHPFGCTEEGWTEKEPQINTNILNTKKLNTKREGRALRDHREKNRKRFSPPTLEEIETYIQESGLNVDAQGFFDYYEQVGWVVGRTHKQMASWKAALRYWARKDKADMQQREEKNASDRQQPKKNIYRAAVRDDSVNKTKKMALELERAQIEAGKVAVLNE